MKFTKMDGGTALIYNLILLFAGFAFPPLLIIFAINMIIIICFAIKSNTNNKDTYIRDVPEVKKSPTINIYSNSEAYNELASVFPLEILNDYLSIFNPRWDKIPQILEKKEITAVEWLELGKFFKASAYHKSKSACEKEFGEFSSWHKLNIYFENGEFVVVPYLGYYKANYSIAFYCLEKSFELGAAESADILLTLYKTNKFPYQLKSKEEVKERIKMLSEFIENNKKV